MASSAELQFATEPCPLDLALALQSDRGLRDNHGLFYAEGVRNFLSAADNDWPIHTVYFSDKLLKPGAARTKVRALRREGIPIVELSPEAFRSLSNRPRASGVGLVLHQPRPSLHQLKPRTARCWLVVDNIEHPGNIGTLLRTSAAIGGGGLIVVGDEVDVTHPSLVRASMGTYFRQVVTRTSLRQFENWVGRHRLPVFGATADARRSHFDTRFANASVLVLGNERKGLSDGLRRVCRSFVRIPMTEGLDSLNVSVAGSLLMYEVFRGSCRR